MHKHAPQQVKLAGLLPAVIAAVAQVVPPVQQSWGVEHIVSLIRFALQETHNAQDWLVAQSKPAILPEPHGQMVLFVQVVKNAWHFQPVE